MLTVGSICTGFGGLDLALGHAGVDHQMAWVSEIDETANAVLAHRWPTVPNIGDITNAKPEPVDLITAGFPCQDISTAGRQAGIHGARSGLWWAIRDTIAAIEPRWVFLENVAAIRTLGGPEVARSLAELGYLGRFGIVRASDVGAPHRRARWFCLAWHPDRTGRPCPGQPGPATERCGDAPNPERQGRERGMVDERRDRPAIVDPTTPNPDRGGQSSVGRGGLQPVERDADRRRSEISGDPTTPNPDRAGRRSTGPRPEPAEPAELRWVGLDDDGEAPDPKTWGRYAAAVARWETLTRPAPPARTGTPHPVYGRLSPRFVEWMMGLPDGWVTGVPTIPGQSSMFPDLNTTDTPRALQLRCLGNGVVPQQAAAALCALGVP